MKKLLICFGVLCGHLLAQGQTPGINAAAIHDSIIKKINSVDTQFSAHLSKRLFSNQTYSQFFDDYFTRLSFDKDGIPKGNSVSLKTSTDETQLNLNLAYKTNHWIYAAGANLGVSNNIANIFSDGDVTAGTSYYLKFAYLFSKTNQLFFSGNNKMKIDILRNQFLDSMRAEFGKYLAIKAGQLNTTLQTIDQQLKDLTITDEMRVQLVEKRRDVTKELQDDGLRDDPDATISKISDLIDSTLYKLETGNNGWTRFSLSWLTGGINYSKLNYSTFDSTQTFSSQINSRNFDSLGLSLSFNWFDQIAPWYSKAMGKTFSSFYASGTYSIYRSNSYTALSNNTLLVNKIIDSANSNHTIQDSKNVKIISGVPYTQYWMHDFAAMGSFIFAKPGNMGINLNADALVSSVTKPVYTSRIGLLFYLTNTDDPKSKLSFELFLQLPDMSDNLGSGKSTWQRKVIGINTSIPFSKVFFRNN